MDTTPTPNAPIETLRDGRIKVSIWENVNDKNEVYHTTTLAKIYEDRNGKLRDTHSLSGGEVLRGASLLQEAHGVIRDIRRDLSHDRRADQRPQQDQAPRQETRPSRFQGRGTGPNMER